MDIKSLFGNRLRQLRQQRNIPQKTLGEVLEVSENAIGMMERGSRGTTIEKLALLADYFQVSTDYLLGLTDNPAEKTPEEGQAARLAAYDRMYADLIKERDKVLADMERLRETKKQKGATYQQLLAQKLTLQNLISRFETYGIRQEWRTDHPVDISDAYSSDNGFMFSKEKFSGRLAELRAERQVSSQVLAEAIGISRPAVSRFEHGVDFPHVNTLVALADYFDVSLDYLAGRSDDPVRH